MVGTPLLDVRYDMNGLSIAEAPGSSRVQLISSGGLNEGMYRDGGCLLAWQRPT